MKKVKSEIIVGATQMLRRDKRSNKRSSKTSTRITETRCISEISR
jgi:hypothetical protein